MLVDPLPVSVLERWLEVVQNDEHVGEWQACFETPLLHAGLTFNQGRVVDRVGRFNRALAEFPKSFESYFESHYY